MEAGKLDRRLTLRRAVPELDDLGEPVTDEFGTPIVNWTDIGTVWASKEDVRDVERVRAQQVGASLTTRFQIRPLADGARPSVKDHVICEGIEYEVGAVKEIARRAGWELSATAQLP